MFFQIYESLLINVISEYSSMNYDFDFYDELLLYLTLECLFR